MPKNSTSWKPGQSGNPAGRPKNTRYFSDVAKELLTGKKIDVTWTITDEKGNKKTKRLNLESSEKTNYGIAAALIVEAVKGNVQAAKELIDRVEGRPKQAVEMSGGLGLGDMSLDEIKELLAEVRARRT